VKLHPTSHGCLSYHALAFSADHRPGSSIVGPAVTRLVADITSARIPVIAMDLFFMVLFGFF
jgi:hypothetical protein